MVEGSETLTLLHIGWMRWGPDPQAGSKRTKALFCVARDEVRSLLRRGEIVHNHEMARARAGTREELDKGAGELGFDGHVRAAEAMS